MIQKKSETEFTFFQIVEKFILPPNQYNCPNAVDLTPPHSLTHTHKTHRQPNGCANVPQFYVMELSCHARGLSINFLPFLA